MGGSEQGNRCNWKPGHPLKVYRGWGGGGVARGEKLMSSL